MASPPKEHSYRGYIITEEENASGGLDFKVSISGSTVSRNTLGAAKKLIDDALKQSGKRPPPDEPDEEPPPPCRKVRP